MNCCRRCNYDLCQDCFNKAASTREVESKADSPQENVDMADSSQENADKADSTEDAPKHEEDGDAQGEAKDASHDAESDGAAESEVKAASPGEDERKPPSPDDSKEDEVEADSPKDADEAKPKDAVEDEVKATSSQDDATPRPSSEVKLAFSKDEDISITIVIDDDDSTAKELKLRHGQAINVGRFVHNHVVLEHRGISNKHCELKLVTDGSGAPALAIRDMSSNGTGLQPPGATGAVMLSKGHETPVPDGSLLVLPMKDKKGDDPAWNQRRSFTVRFGGLTAEQIARRDAKARQPEPPKVSEQSRQEQKPSLPEPTGQLPAVDSLLGTAVGSKSRSASPRAAATTVDAPRVKFSLAGNSLRPKAMPKKPDASASAAETTTTAAVTADAKASRKGASPQKSRSRDRSASGSAGRSKSRGRGRGRGRKRGRSCSQSRSPSRKRKRKRKRSKSRRRKRRRSKSQSSRSRSQDEEQPAAPGGKMGQAGNPMAGMQPSWGMAWGAQGSPWGWNPHMQGATQPQMNVDIIRQQIYFMYQRYKPEKLPEFENIMKKYKGSEYDLLKAMMEKYLGAAVTGGGQMAAGQQ